MLLRIRRLLGRKIKLSDLVRTKSRVSYPRSSPLVCRHGERLRCGLILVEPPYRDTRHPHGKAE